VTDAVVMLAIGAVVGDLVGRLVGWTVGSCVDCKRRGMCFVVRTREKVSLRRMCQLSDSPRR
jgi:hypothetical protein